MNGLKLGRKGKIVLNLLLVLLLWVGIWLNNGAPYPSAEMELRRMERENLLPPSDIIFWNEGPGKYNAHMVGVGDDWVVSGSYLRDDGESKGIAVYPRTEEPMLIKLRHYIEKEDAEGNIRWGEGLALIQTPEEAAVAELEICWAHWGGPADGGVFRETRREDGTFCFWFDPDAVDMNGERIGFNWSLEGESYVLRLYTEDGSLLEQCEGYIPRGVFIESHRWTM